MKYFLNKKKIFICFFFFFLFLSNNAFAYLDPGSINIFFQIGAALLSSLLLLASSVNNLILYILQKKLVNTIIFVTLSIFPIWLFKSSFDFNWLIIYFIIIFCIPFFLILFCLRNVGEYYISSKLTIIQNVIISLIILYGLDQHIGLWEIINYFLIPSKSLYVLAIILVILLWIIIFYMIKKSYFKYIFMLLVVTFSHNLISQDKSLNNLQSKISFNYYENVNLTINNSRDEVQPILFIVLDEMNGIGGLDTEIKNYKKAEISYLDLAKTHKFTIYPNSYTPFTNTVQSIPRMLNFDNSLNIYNHNYIKNHKEYFFSNKLIKNRLFDSFDNKKIYVKQNRSIDYCNNVNVLRCDTFNPLSKKVFKQSNYSNPILSEFISKFSYQNSIFSRFLSRFFVELNFINLFTTPRSNKAYFKKDLLELFEVIKNEEYDLYFAHFNVPHKPFGFDKKCNYKNFRVLSSNIEFKKTQHNVEIYCTNLFLNNFLKKMKKLDNYNDFKIIIVSDHGARNSLDPKDHFSVVTIVKDFIKKPLIDEKIISVQSVVSDFFIQTKTSDHKINKYYNEDLKKFIDINFD